jgi:hypothetical protein
MHSSKSCRRRRYLRPCRPCESSRGMRRGGDEARASGGKNSLNRRCLGVDSRNRTGDLSSTLLCSLCSLQIGGWVNECKRRSTATRWLDSPPPDHREESRLIYDGFVIIDYRLFAIRNFPAPSFGNISPSCRGSQFQSICAQLELLPRTGELRTCASVTVCFDFTLTGMLL